MQTNHTSQDANKAGRQAGTHQQAQHCMDCKSFLLHLLTSYYFFYEELKVSSIIKFKDMVFLQVCQQVNSCDWTTPMIHCSLELSFTADDRWVSVTMEMPTTFQLYSAVTARANVKATARRALSVNWHSRCYINWLIGSETCSTSKHRPKHPIVQTSWKVYWWETTSWTVIKGKVLALADCYETC